MGGAGMDNLSYLSWMPRSMKSKYGRKALLFYFFLMAGSSASGYTIRGTLGNMTCFYPRVYLAVVNRIDGIYSASSQDIIATAELDSAGGFVLTGNDLPAGMGLNRMYVNKDKYTTTSIYIGSERNYILLALNNQSDIRIDCPDFCARFFRYSVRNSADNAALASYESVRSGFDSLRWSAGWETYSAAKKALLEQKRYADIKQFADTSGSMLAALRAVADLDVDSSYRNDRVFFDAFAARFRVKSGAPVYARQLDDTLRQLGSGSASDRAAQGWVLYIVSFLLVASVLLNLYQAQKFRRVAGRANRMQAEPTAGPAATDDAAKALIEKLTIKEREILKLVDEGLSNKEIAARLSVEVSTIKSHISSIYQKTGIKSRKEVAGIARLG